MGVYIVEEWSVVLNISFVGLAIMFILFSLVDVNSTSRNQ